MKLKESHPKSWILSSLEQIRHNLPKGRSIILLVSLIAFALGYYVHRSGFSFGRTLSSLIGDITIMPKRVQAILFRPDIQQITIDIKHQDYMKLAYKREVALTRGLLITEDDDFVPATIQYAGKLIKVKIRLKGDGVDHLQEDKWSFRIRVSGDNTIFGLKEFSVQHPKTRNYIYEWLFHQALKREGVLSLRYEFINVTLNGKNLGVYALEEHFDKHLIEHNHLREGPIIKFNEDLAWEEGGTQWWENDEYITYYYASDIDAFQTNKLLSDPTSYGQFIKAKNLLELSRRGELRTSDVYDTQKLASFFALSDLVGSYHSKNWNNLRFYYNPLTSRLEPIGFDAFSGQKISRLAMFPLTRVTSIHSEIIFSDPVFLQEYIEMLERVSEPSYLDTLLADLDGELKQNLNIIYSEFPEFDFSKEILYQNQNYIRAVLNPVKALQAYHHRSSENQIELELGNIQSMPLEVLNVSYRDSVLFQPVREVILPKSTVLDSQPVDYQIVGFALPKDFVWLDTMVRDLKVNYQLLGTSQIRQETVFPWSYLDTDFLDKDFIRQPPNFYAFDFLMISESTREIFVKPGTWDLDQNLIIPGGYRLIAGEGVQLNLSNSAKILSYSPLALIGSEDYPITIRSRDGRGQGLVVMNAGQESVLEYVTFENLTNPLQDGWELTGAVTFYESPVHISHSQFVGNRSEDALNIFRSDFSIHKTLFAETHFDALDADFSTGSITNSSFVAIGNDAIDTSGSIIEIQDVFINGSGDKGLSVGEMSKVILKRMDIRDTSLAVASKDMSQITAQNIHISDSEVGLAIYQKKSEFGPATIRVEGLEMMTVRTPYLVEEGSVAVVDNQVIEAKETNVYQNLYGTESSP